MAKAATEIKDLKDAVFTVKIQSEFKIRTWIATRLIKLAVHILRADLKLTVNNDAPR